MNTTHLEILNRQIEVEDGYTLSDEWRPPKSGDMVVNNSGQVMKWDDIPQFNREGPWLIVREVWQPEPWMPRGCYLARSYSDHWFFTNVEPRKRSSGTYYIVGDSIAVAAKSLLKLARLTDPDAEFTPPPENMVYIPTEWETPF